MPNICSGECEQPAAGVFLNRVPSVQSPMRRLCGRMHTELLLSQGIYYILFFS